jgi:hypothetical protein
MWITLNNKLISNQKEIKKESGVSNLRDGRVGGSSV